MEKRRILWVYTGFGSPNLQEKITILRHNLKSVSFSEETTSLFVLIFLYSTEFPLEDFLDPKELGVPIVIVRKEGRIGDYIYQYLSNELTNHFDTIMIMLDDVELMDKIHLEDIIRIQEGFQIDVLSPSIHHSSPSGCHRFMLRDYSSGGIRWTNFAELFLYVFSRSGFQKYYALFTEETRFMWGIDIAMQTSAQMTIAIMDEWSVRHHFSNTYQNPDVLREVKKELAYTQNRLKNNDFKFQIHSRLSDSFSEPERWKIHQIQKLYQKYIQEFFPSHKFHIHQSKTKTE